MTEINTFSSLVDAAITRSKRRDRLSDILSCVRLTMRELQSMAQFDADLVEDELTADDDPFIWDVPVNYRSMVAVEYADIIDEQGNPIYPRFRRPSRAQKNHEYFYYRSGSSIVFGGIAATVAMTSRINVGYLVYFPTLQYYADEADRPARFILEDNDWEYLAAYVTDEEKETARLLSSNWLLERWYDLVLEGTLAKLYKLVGDERSMATYALYKSLHTPFMNGESMASVGGEAS